MEKSIEEKLDCALRGLDNLDKTDETIGITDEELVCAIEIEEMVLKFLEKRTGARFLLLGLSMELQELKTLIKRRSLK